jgi:hypothetical protein
MRNLNAHEATHEGIVKLYKLLKKDDPEFVRGHEPDDGRRYLPSMLKLSLNILPRLGDLHCKILVNATNAPFITSDNPSVVYNQFFEAGGAFGGFTGYASVGCQMFCPLSPTKMAFFYDPNIYVVGSRHSNAVILRNQADVDTLNRAQMIACNENCYFTSGVNEAYLQGLLKRAVKYRVEEKTEVSEHPAFIEGSGEWGEIIAMRPTERKWGPQWSFIKFTKKSKQIPSFRGQHGPERKYNLPIPPEMITRMGLELGMRGLEERWSKSK